MKSALTHLILLIVLCASALVGYRFWYGEVVAKSAAVAKLEKQLVTERSISTRSVSARTTLNELASDEARMQSYFVFENDVPALIDDLQARGRAQGTSMRVGSVTEKGTATDPTIVLTVAIEGTFDAVMRTVGVIEHVPRALRVTRLDLAHDEKKNWHASLELVVGSAEVVLSLPKKP